MRGWRYEGYRHSLAARGIRTSFGKWIKSPEDLEKKYFKDWERGIESIAEVKTIKRGTGGPSKKGGILEEISWIENLLEDEEAAEELSEDRRKQLGESLRVLKEKASHLTGNPPIRIIKATEDIPLGLFERYRGVSSRRLPEAVKPVLEEAELKGLLDKPEIEKLVAYEEKKRQMGDDRAVERVLEAIDAKSTRFEPEEIEEAEFLEPDVLIKSRKDILYAAKNPRVTAEYYRYRQESPKKYDEFRSKSLPSGKVLVLGRKKTKSKDPKFKRKWEVQSILVPKR